MYDVVNTHSSRSELRQDETPGNPDDDNGAYSELTVCKRKKAANPSGVRPLRSSYSVIVTSLLAHNRPTFLVHGTQNYTLNSHSHVRDSDMASPVIATGASSLIDA